ncbi:MAG: hypothetical protein J0M20_08680 [Burkholderiales bacterium]|nr:hypothetical protein [Burkholderiales bacterium]
MKRPLLAMWLAAAVQAGAWAAPAQVLQVEDAERFAALLADGRLPDADTLQRAYLTPGSAGVALFTPGRIESAQHLAQTLHAQPQAYRKAIALCLPAARDIAQPAGALMVEVARRLGQPAEGAPAFALFGAMNSGGTAKAQGLGLGLEVLCQSVDTPQDARALLLDFVAHEITHVHQQRHAPDDVRFTLLYATLMEGFADYMMEQARGAPSGPSADRERYGLAHEAELWRAFQADVARGAGFGDWLYKARPARAGQPADMGYWLGKRLCEAFVARAPDRAAALHTLLLLRDPAAIVAASGYAPR